MTEKQILDNSKLLGAMIFDYRNNPDDTFSPTQEILFTIAQLKKLIEFASATQISVAEAKFKLVRELLKEISEHTEFDINYSLAAKELLEKIGE